MPKPKEEPMMRHLLASSVFILCATAMAQTGPLLDSQMILFNLVVRIGILPDPDRLQLASQSVLKSDCAELHPRQRTQQRAHRQRQRRD
jgi:hypothetical protein